MKGIEDIFGRPKPFDVIATILQPFFALDA